MLETKSGNEPRANAKDKFQSSLSTNYVEIKHYDWFKLWRMTHSSQAECFVLAL